MIRVLALSSSRVGNGGYLETAAKFIDDFLGTKKCNIAFIPFASVKKDYDEYLAMVQKALSHLNYSIQLCTEENAKEILVKSDVVMVGGGNTFKLLHDLYSLDLIELIRKKINDGNEYIGWSAGANLAGLSISTTNDMPIIQPQSFVSFKFFSFQINPHYISQIAKGFHGETRDQRLEEFVLLNPQAPVIGLPEGSALVLEDNRLKYAGSSHGVLFHNKAGAVIKEKIEPEKDLSFLL